MNVLYLADTRFPIERANGVQTMATCHALASRGHHVTLVVRPDHARVARDPFAFYGVPAIDRLRMMVIPADGGPRVRRVRFLMTAVRLATTRRDHVVMTRDLGLAAWLVQVPKVRRPRVVYESHGLADTVAQEMPALLGKPALMPGASKLTRLGRREARVWARAAAYITITGALAGELAMRFGPRERVFVVPDGARLPPGSLAPPPLDGPFVAAYAGHLYPWKGVDVFVRAVARTPAIHGLIVGGHPGEPDVERVRALARDLGVADRLTITGLVVPAEVGPRLAAASALVLPNVTSAISERYTSPLKLFEYLTIGRPIVASDLPSIKEIVTDGESALLVPAGDADALAAALQRIARDPVLAATLGAGAAALAPRYTWDARAERIEAALDAAAAS